MTPVAYLETGVLYCDDNLHRLSQFPADCIDLIYLDPPFFSNKQYEVIWGDEAEVRSFEDRWEGGIQVYIAWMRERVMELHRILKPTGSLYLHCDWHASHYLKVMMDDIFGRENFLNNVVWCYGLGGSSSRYWPRKHDDILWYCKKRDAHYFEAAQVPATSNRMKGEMKKAPDYWDIPTINNMAKERLGYPTQKPEELLMRIVESSSRKSEIVLDPFAGCGTAIVVAQQLGRQWIGIDISPTAVGLMKRRMEKVGAAGFRLVGMPVSEEQLRALKPFEFQNWVIQRFNGTHSPRKSGDMGIDGYSFFEHLPIQVKQSQSVGRNVVDNFETAVERGGKEKGYIVAFSFTRGAHEEAAAAKARKGIDILLVSVADLLIDATDLVTPESGQLFGEDVPLPKAAPPEARPSAEELIASDKGVG